MSTLLSTTVMERTSVDELVDRTGKGELTSFQELHRRLRADVLSTVLSTVTDRDQALMVTNGVWLEVWWLSRRRQPGDDVLAWLRTITNRRSDERARLMSAGVGRHTAHSRSHDEHVRSVLSPLLNGSARHTRVG